MSEALTLPADLRERAGKGASRALRKEGRTPAVIYGGKDEPTLIHVEEKLLMKQLMTGFFTNSIVMIELGGKKVRTLPKDVVLHPVTSRPVHVDFLRLAADARIEVAVPVIFINEEDSPGLKRGGVLNVVRHELELICDASSIPNEIEIDVSGTEVGDAIHISLITLPEGAESVIDRDFTIATIVAPSALKRAEGEADDEDETEGEQEEPEES